MAVFTHFLLQKCTPLSRIQSLSSFLFISLCVFVFAAESPKNCWKSKVLYCSFYPQLSSAATESSTALLSKLKSTLHSSGSLGRGRSLSSQLECAMWRRWILWWLSFPICSFSLSLSLSHTHTHTHTHTRYQRSSAAALIELRLRFAPSLQLFREKRLLHSPRSPQVGNIERSFLLPLSLWGLGRS